jgi:D-methionine transport system substrate-binding protein
MNNRLKRVLLAALLTVSAAGALSAQEKSLKLGVTAGPYGDVDRFAASLASKQGLKVEVIEFADYQMPNVALASGDIDFNDMQSRKYLKAQTEARGYDFVVIAPTIIVPIGLYSSKHRNISDIPAGSQIGVPNDPANLTRALGFLERRGLIKLKPESQDTATLLDISDNPKKLRFVELDHGLLARSLDDTEASIITLNYALNVGLDPSKALSLEDYTNDFNTVNFVAKRGRENEPGIQKFIGIYRSDEVKNFVREKFKGHVLTAW